MSFLGNICDIEVIFNQCKNKFLGKTFILKENTKPRVEMHFIPHLSAHLEDVKLALF